MNILMLIILKNRKHKISNSKMENKEVNLKTLYKSFIFKQI